MNTTINTMWLQLFAVITTDGVNANGTVTSGSVGTGPANADLSPAMKEWYDKYIIEKAGPELIHDQVAVKVPLPKNKGKSVEFHEFMSYPKAMTPLSEGVTPLGRNMEMTSIISTIEQYGDYTKITDMLDMTSVDPIIAQATKAHARQAGLTLDTVTRNVLNGGTRVFFCQEDGDGEAPTDSAATVKARNQLTANCKLTVKAIQQAVTLFEADNVPKIDGFYVAFIHPMMKYELMRDPEWVDAHKYTTPENIYKNEIGQIAGVRFIQSSEAKIFRGTDDQCPEGLAVFSTILLGADAYGVTELEGGGLEVIVKPLGAGDDPLNQRQTVGWKATKTAERLIEDYIMRIEACSPRYSATAKAN